MKCIKFAKWAIMLLLLFWVVYNTIFGWNLEAESKAELICDLVYYIGIRLAFCIYILPIFGLYENAVKDGE